MTYVFSIPFISIVEVLYFSFVVYISGVRIYNLSRGLPLLSTVPQLVRLNESTSEILYTFCFSPIMRSIVSFEIDDTCILPSTFDDRASYFPQPNQLTDIRITLEHFDHCVSLLKQIGRQLCSLSLNILYVGRARLLTIWQIPTVSDISLFEI